VPVDATPPSFGGTFATASEDGVDGGCARAAGGWPARPDARTTASTISSNDGLPESFGIDARGLPGAVAVDDSGRRVAAMLLANKLS
jgi:hypothetical protein